MIMKSEEYQNKKKKSIQIPPAGMDFLGLPVGPGSPSVLAKKPEDDEDYEEFMKHPEIAELRNLEKQATVFVADLLFFLDKFVRKFDDKKHAVQLILSNLFFRKNLLNMRKKCHDF